MRRFVVHQHRQLTAKNGDLVAGNGESVAADHPAVLALLDPASVGRFVDDAPVSPASLEYAPAQETLADPDDAQEEPLTRKTKGGRSD